MNTKEEELAFLKNINGVKPIKKKSNITKKIKKISRDLISKETKQKHNTTDPDKTKKERPKIQNFYIEFGKINKDLKKGKIAINKKIDFHGMSFAQAEKEFLETIISSYNERKRSLLFITGKGLHKSYYLENQSSQKQPRLYYGKIRKGLLEWIKKPQLAKYILAAEPASGELGGDGAFHVYLRKKPI